MEVATKIIVLGREEFYDLVWSEPMASILKKYEIYPPN
jgi:hypothetical protein